MADRVTVLRDGERIITAPVCALTIDEIIRNMVGRTADRAVPLAPATPGEEVAARGRADPSQGVCTDVSSPCPARRDPGVGRAGGGGPHRDHAADLSATGGGTRAGSSSRGWRPTSAPPGTPCAHGIALIPEERKKPGPGPGPVGLGQLALTDPRPATRWPGFIRWREVDEPRRQDGADHPACGPRRFRRRSGTSPAATSRRWCSRSGSSATATSTSSTSRPAASTSAPRWRSTSSCRSLAARGAAIIMVSSELLEVMNMSDRIAVV